MRASSPAAVPPIVRQLVSYAVIGVVTTGIYYGLWALLFGAGVDYRPASGVGYGVGSLVNFGLQKVVTFRDRRRGVAMGAQFLVYWLIVAASLAVTVGLVWVGVAAAGLPEWASVVATSVVVLALNFAAHRGITFNPRLWDPVPRPPGRVR